MTSMSAIAGASNSGAFSSLGASVPDTVKVQKTDHPQELHGEKYALDLRTPENIKPDTAVYDEKTGNYKVGTRLGDKFLSQPWMLTPNEYLQWSEKQSFNKYFKTRNDSLFVTKGKEKFDFSDMHFDLGPAEKIFGPGGVQIRTRGSAELKFGYNYKFVDNPSMAERNRTTKAFDFDEKINADVNAKVGDKMSFDIRYNTE